jgi:hypothetical protein
MRRTRSAIAPGSLFFPLGGPPDRQSGRQPPPLGVQVPFPVEKDEKSLSTFSDLQTGHTIF